MAIKLVGFVPVDGETWPIGYQYRDLGRPVGYGWHVAFDDGEVISDAIKKNIQYEFRKPVCDCCHSPSVSIDDGGPAYPVLGYYEDGKFKQGAQTANHEGWYEGMSLRDFFAGKAMTGFLAYSPTDDELGYFYDCEGLESRHAEKLAKDCYLLADAMLAARKGGAT